MRIALLVLGVLLIALQYRFWFGDGGILERRQLQSRVAQLQAQVAGRRERNQTLEAEVLDLRHNLAAVEERARRDLGMIRKGEVYVMVMEGR